MSSTLDWTAGAAAHTKQHGCGRSSARCAAAVTWGRPSEWAQVLPPALGRLAVAGPAQQALVSVTPESVTQHLQVGDEPDQHLFTAPGMHMPGQRESKGSA